MRIARSVSIKRIEAGIATVLFLLVSVVERASAQEHAFGVQAAVTYAKAAGVELQLDIAYPTDSAGPFPALIYICGNGWGWYSSINRSQYFYSDIKSAARRGYVAITVDYRYISLKENGKTKYVFPSQLYDVKCAVRWLRSNASVYHIDPKHIGAIGWSSGGHLALMLGLTDPTDGLEGECGDMQQSSRVQAVVNLAGPTELTSLYSVSAAAADRVIQLIGGTPDQMLKEYSAASPVNYVSIDDPPVLTIEGNLDPAEKQAEILDRKMKEIGVSHTLIMKQGLGHENFSNEEAMWEFLERTLK